MTEGLAVAIVGAIATVLVAVVGVFGALINNKLGRVRAQVENSHTTNLRDELDNRHNETRGWFAAIWHRLEAGDRRFEEHTQAIQSVQSTLDQLTGRVDDVEKTIPPKE